MAKQCASFDITPFPKLNRILIIIRPLGGDIWSALKLHVALGKRISAQLKVPILIEANSSTGGDVAVYYHAFQASIEAPVWEDLAHSLYLWLEHPERY